MKTWPGWGADENLLPGSFVGDDFHEHWQPSVSMPSRGEAIRAILDAVELEGEAAVEVALMALGVNPVELLFAVSP